MAAIIEDDAPTETRWRYFLRYFQGKVNQEDIADYDEEDEGFRYEVGRHSDPPRSTLMLNKMGNPYNGPAAVTRLNIICFDC